MLGLLGLVRGGLVRVAWLGGLLGLVRGALVW